jgi:hypothetical protein
MIHDSGCRIQDSEFRIQDLGFRIQDSEFGFHGAGYRIQAVWCVKCVDRDWGFRGV